MVRSALFRDEACRHQAAQHLGPIRIGRQPRFEAVAAVAALLMVLMALYATHGHITRSARVAGVLMPTLGSLPVRAAGMGTVAELPAAEGASVPSGAVLAVLQADRAGREGDAAELAAQALAARRAALDDLRALRREQARQRADSLAQRAQSLAQAQALAADAVQLAESRVALADERLQRLRPLAGEGFVSQAQVWPLQESLLEAQQRAAAARRDLEAVEREQRAVQAEQAALQAQQRDGDLTLGMDAAALAQEQAENQARRHTVVRAPQAGTITALHVHPGEPVQAGQVLATLVPHAPGRDSPELEAQLYAPSQTAGFVQPGQAVYLRYAAYPFEKFGFGRGEVTAVSLTPVNPAELPQGHASALLRAAQREEPLFRIRVRLQSQHVVAEGQAHALKPGLWLQADIVQDRRALWEWIAAPLMAARGGPAPSPGPGRS